MSIPWEHKSCETRLGCLDKSPRSVGTPGFFRRRTASFVYTTPAVIFDLRLNCHSCEILSTIASRRTTSLFAIAQDRRDLSKLFAFEIILKYIGFQLLLHRLQGLEFHRQLGSRGLQGRCCSSFQFLFKSSLTF